MESEKKSRKNTEHLKYGLLILVIAVVLFNQYQIGAVKNAIDSGALVKSTTSSKTSASAGTTLSTIDVIPTGTPKIYGGELSISFDDVSANNPTLADKTIGVLGDLDRTLSLSGDDLNRYITIASKISCEYCCGARSIITSDGRAACGCAHSYAMRGLAKYLILNHPDEFTDDQILEELAKWKTLFFPTQITQKAAILKDQGIEINYINLASNEYRGIERSASSSGGGMVGGC